jgi:hypothetical protein
MGAVPGCAMPMIEVVLGDITAERVDAMVTAADESLLGRGGAPVSGGRNLRGCGLDSAGHGEAVGFHELTFLAGLAPGDRQWLSARGRRNAARCRPSNGF